MTTIKTRCVSLNLKSVPEKTLGRLYDRVVKAEGIELPGDIGDLIIKEAGGSPRQMLVNLALCTDAKTKAEAAALLQSAQASDPTIKLARYLCFERRKDWAGAMKIVAEFTDESPEGVRIVICNYVAACLKNPKVAKPEWLLHILEMFSEPYREYEKMGPLMLSIGRVLYA
jgi:DNA polymerase III gamma/tau subunit